MADSNANVLNTGTIGADGDMAVESASRWSSTSTDASAKTDLDALNFWNCGSGFDQVYMTQDTVDSFVDFNDAHFFFGPLDACADVQNSAGCVEEVEDDAVQSYENGGFPQDFNPMRMEDPQQFASTTEFSWPLAGIIHTSNSSSLKYQINAAMCHNDGGRLFLPDDSLKTILSTQAVQTELRRHFSAMPAQDLLRLVERISAKSFQGWLPYTGLLRTFAILVLIDRVDKIAAFVDEDLNDMALPLVKLTKPATIEDSETVELRRKDALGVQMRCFRGWSQTDIHAFEQIQWQFLAPVFSDIVRKQVDFLNLEDRVILPFTESTEEKKQDHYKGGYSEVWRVKIHPAHHNFHKPSSSFAIKRLTSTDEASFRREVEVLQRLHNADHPNVVSLLATYKYRGYYHLIFPWADGDLRRLWQMNSVPRAGKEEARWLASQCAGIASALNHVHNGADSWLNGSAGPEPPNPGDQRLDISPRQFYGLHGDIKPENIFVFSRGQKSLPTLELPLNNPSHGPVDDELVIGDFGGGLFYDATAHPDPLRQITTTYRPPEYDTRLKPMSRSFDIWGLGCTYLEFLTWFLKGSAGLSEFAKHRTTLTAAGKLSDEYFETFLTGPDNERLGAILKGPVLNWINSLYSHQKSSNFVREFLDFITHRMFIVENETMTRASCEEVSTRMNELMRKCYDDDMYCVPSTAGSSSTWDVMTIESSTSGSPQMKALDFSSMDMPVNFNFDTPETFDFDLLDKWNTAPTNSGNDVFEDDLGFDPIRSNYHTTPVLPAAHATFSCTKPERKRKRELGATDDGDFQTRRVSPKITSIIASTTPEQCSTTTTTTTTTPTVTATTTASTNPKDKRFACPYYKSNPAKFRHKRTCCGPGWPTVHRVKEHLYRCHTIGKHTCSRCLLRCKTSAELLGHQRAAFPCAALAGTDAFPEGTMLPCQEEALRVKKRVGADKGEKAKWGEMYGVLFPGAAGEDLPSPFYEDEGGLVVGEAGTGWRDGAVGAAHDSHDDNDGVVSGYERYLSGSLPPDVQRELEKEVCVELGFAGDEARTRRVVNMVRELQLRLFRRYEDSRRVAAG